MPSNYTFDFLVLFMAFLFFLMFTAVSCTTEPIRQFNSDDLEDKGCYLKHGAEIGYCLSRDYEVKAY